MSFWMSFVCRFVFHSALHCHCLLSQRLLHVGVSWFTFASTGRVFDRQTGVEWTRFFLSLSVSFAFVLRQFSLYSLVQTRYQHSVAPLAGLHHVVVVSCSSLLPRVDLFRSDATIPLFCVWPVCRFHQAVFSVPLRPQRR